MKWFKKLTPEEIAAKEEDERTTYASVDEMFDDFEASMTLWDKIVRRFHLWFINPIKDAGWRFLYRFHPRHRYNIVKTGLPAKYYDTDTRMEAAIIKLFVDYVEIEKPFEHFDTEESHHREDWRRIKGLYEYFKQIDVLNQPHQQYENSVKKLTRENYEEYARISNKLSREFTERLCEVVRLRGHYWT